MTYRNVHHRRQVEEAARKKTERSRTHTSSGAELLNPANPLSPLNPVYSSESPSSDAPCSDSGGGSDNSSSCD